jgi:hypothetical protein
LGKLRLGCKRLVVTFNRLVETPKLAQCDAPVDPGKCEIGLQRNCMVITGQRRLKTIEIGQGKPAIVEPLRDAGPDREGSVEYLQRLRETAPCHQQRAVN